MEGAADRDRRAMQQIVAQAWWNENLNGAGTGLKHLGHYLDMLKPRKPLTSDDVLNVFKAHRDLGAPIKIRHIGPDGKELN